MSGGGSPRHLRPSVPAAIALQEMRRLLGPKAGRTMATVALVLVATTLALPLLQDRVPMPERSMHSVILEDGSPYTDALLSDPRFRAVEGGIHDVRQGRVSLWAGATIEPAPGERGAAALAAARQAIRVWTEARMQQEPDQGAAFPVLVDIVLVPPARAAALATPGPTPDPAQEPDRDAPRPGPTPGHAPTNDPGSGPDPTGDPTSDPGPEPTGSGPSPGGDPGAPSPTQDPAPQPSPPGPDAQRIQGLRPSEVQLPMAGLGLLATFAYAIPMNVVGQMCASGFLQERTRRRGLLTLTAPVAPGTVLASRLAPYAATALLVSVVATTAVGAGAQGYLGGALVVAIPLSFSLVLGLVARSERELTFLITAAMTTYSFFLFLPAMFRSLPPIAFLSPLTVVLESAEGTVSLPHMMYALLPGALGVFALTAFARALYRDETLHSPLPIMAKTAQGLARVTATVPRTVLVAALLVPFAFALEMLAVAFLIPLGLALLFPGFLIAVAVIEELLKRLPIRARLESLDAAGTLTPRARLATAVAVGVGFFLGEKLALLLSWTGLGGLRFGLATLGLFGIGSAALLALPLLLHTSTSWLLAQGGGRPASTRRAMLAAAILLHLVYDAIVILVGVRL